MERATGDSRQGSSLPTFFCGAAAIGLLASGIFLWKRGLPRDPIILSRARFSRLAAGGCLAAGGLCALFLAQRIRARKPLLTQEELLSDQEVTIRDRRITAELLEQLSQSVERLVFINCDLPSEDLSWVPESLKHLTLDNCGCVGVTFSSLKSLTIINMEVTKIEGASGDLYLYRSEVTGRIEPESFNNLVAVQTSVDLSGVTSEQVAVAYYEPTETMHERRPWPEPPGIYIEDCQPIDGSKLPSGKTLRLYEVRDLRVPQDCNPSRHLELWKSSVEWERTPDVPSIWLIQSNMSILDGIKQAVLWRRDKDGDCLRRPTTKEGLYIEDCSIRWEQLPESLERLVVYDVDEVPTKWARKAEVRQFLAKQEVQEGEVIFRGGQLTNSQLGSITASAVSLVDCELEEDSSLADNLPEQVRTLTLHHGSDQRLTLDQISDTVERLAVFGYKMHLQGFREGQALKEITLVGSSYDWPTRGSFLYGMERVSMLHCVEQGSHEGGVFGGWVVLARFDPPEGEMLNPEVRPWRAIAYDHALYVEIRSGQPLPLSILRSQESFELYGVRADELPEDLRSKAQEVIWSEDDPESEAGPEVQTLRAVDFRDGLPRSVQDNTEVLRIVDCELGRGQWVKQFLARLLRLHTLTIENPRLRSWNWLTDAIPRSVEVLRLRLHGGTRELEGANIPAFIRRLEIVGSPSFVLQWRDATQKPELEELVLAGCRSVGGLARPNTIADHATTVSLIQEKSLDAALRKLSRQCSVYKHLVLARFDAEQEKLLDPDCRPWKAIKFRDAIYVEMRAGEELPELEKDKVEQIKLLDINIQELPEELRDRVVL